MPRLNKHHPDHKPLRQEKFAVRDGHVLNVLFAEIELLGAQGYALSDAFKAELKERERIRISIPKRPKP